MPSDPDFRSRYLELALDTRKVIDCLMTFVDEGRHEQDLDDTLEHAIESLNAAVGQASVFTPLRSRFAFSNYYEQLRTVDEVLGTDQRQRIIDKLVTVKTSSGDEATQKQDALEAIQLLAGIESRALYNHRPYGE